MDGSIPSHHNRPPKKYRLRDGNVRQGRGSVSHKELKARELEDIIRKIDDGELIIRGRSVREVKARLRARIRDLRA